MFKAKKNQKNTEGVKTIILTLTFLLSTMFTIAQPSEHLSFKGVQIDGKLDDYIAKMKQNGFNHLETQRGTEILNGDFAGYKNCNVRISTLTQFDLVHKISVLFPKQDKWSGLSTNYFELKQMLTEKYGNPKEEVEKFNLNPQPEDDLRKLFEAKRDNCNYYSIWKTEKGEIKLSIDSSCNVKLI